MAAAVLGDAAKVDFVPLRASTRFLALQSGEIDLLVNARTPNRLGYLGDITWRGGEFAVPGPYGVRLGHCGNLLKRFLAQLYANLGEGLAIAVSQRDTTRALLAKHAILCHEVCVTKPQLFVDGLGD